MARARGLILAASITGALASAAPASAAIRYTTPTSPTGNTCAARSPCEIHKAIEQAANGDQVIVEPGTYQLSKGITATKDLNIHGAAGRPRPRLVLSTDSWYPLYIDAPTSATVSDLELEGDGQAIGGLFSAGPSTLSRLVVTVSPFGAVAIGTGDDVLLRDTVAWAQGASGSAVRAYSQTLRLRNVTAIATASGSWGIDATATCHPGPAPSCDPARSFVTVDVKNTITRGGQYDVGAIDDYAGDPATVNLSYSNYRPSMVQLSGTAAVNDQGHNQSATPAFADPLSGDFHELSSSPTVDAGTADPDNGPTDLDGNARSLGAAPDIGEDEFVPPAPPGGGTGGGGDGSGGGTGGGTGGGGGGPGPDTTPPAFLAARMTNTKFAVDPAGPAETVVIARKVKLGTSFAYTLSEPARVLFTIEQKLPGRRVGRTCRKPSRKLAHKKACVRFVRRGAFAQDGATGVNRKRWSGKLGKRALKPGSYRVTLTAKDPAGNVSKVKRLKFKIVRR
jgi:hypothetical protein